MPSLFLESKLFAGNSGLNEIIFVWGMNRRLDSMFRRFLGGRYTAFSVRLYSVSILSMLLAAELAEAFSRVN